MKIKNKIKIVLKSEKLFLMDKALNNLPADHHTFYSLVKDKNNQLLFFKFLLTNVEFKKQSFKREVLFLNFLKNHPVIEIPVPKYRKSSLKLYHSWLLRDAVAGEILGNRLVYAKKFYTAENLTSLKLFISVLQKSTLPIVKFFKKNDFPLPIKDHQWFLRQFRHDYDFLAFYDEIENKLISWQKIKKINYLINKNKNLLNRDLVLAHGDLQAENLIFAKGKIMVIDWENLHLNNHLFDWGYLWLNSWNNLFWRKKIERLIINSKKDNILFTINKIRWLIRMIGLLSHGERVNQNNKKMYNLVKKIKNIHLQELNKIIKQL